MEEFDRPRGNNEELVEWGHLLEDLEYHEPRDDRAGIIYIFLLAILTTLNEESRAALQNEINILFRPHNGVAHVLMNNVDIDESILAQNGPLDNIFRCLNEPSADSWQDLLPPADTERPGPFDDLSDELVFLPNRVHLVCKFLEDLVYTYNNPQVIRFTKYRVYTVFGRPINVNAKLNIFTTRNIVSRIVEGLNNDLR